MNERILLYSLSAVYQLLYFSFQNFDSLYIGHSPSSRVGFNSEFLLSATESKSSKALQRTRTKHELKSTQPATRRTTPESDTQTHNDLSLSGSRLTSTHQ